MIVGPRKSCGLILLMAHGICSPLKDDDGQWKLLKMDL